MQTTINEWLNKYNGTDEKIRKYFYLEWKEGEIIPNKCIFMKTIPEKYNFKHQFKWNLIYYNIELYGNLPKCFFKNNFNIIQFFENRNIISCLKSHLQKCVRRKLLGQAIYTAELYMNINIEDFLRRLTIIMIEDCFFHSSYLILIWFMIGFGNKELKMNNLLKEYLLGVVYFMIKETKYRESYYMEKENINYYNLIFDLDNKGNSQFISFIYSILIRKSFGGMECDMKMLERCAFIWYNRLMKDNIDEEINIFLKKEIRPIKIYNDNLKKEDWFIGAIDFHTHPNILKWLKEKFNDYEDEDIKNAIWYNQSCINYRDFYNKLEEMFYNKNYLQQKEKYKNIWENIQKELYLMRKYLLKKLYEEIENNKIN
jgi:hypothetical protein